MFETYEQMACLIKVCLLCTLNFIICVSRKKLEKYTNLGKSHPLTSEELLCEWRGEIHKHTDVDHYAEQRVLNLQGKDADSYKMSQHFQTATERGIAASKQKLQAMKGDMLITTRAKGTVPSYMEGM